MQSPITFPNVHEEELNEEYMPLRNDDRAWVKTEIENAIDSLKPHGWRKAIFLLREWGILATNITVIVALLGITATAIYHTVADVREEAKFRADETAFRTQTEQTLASIQATLRMLQAAQAAQSAKKVLGEIATLNTKQFAQNLMALRKVSEQPPAQVAPTASELRLVARKLHATDENTPDYWPTVLRFLRFASEGLSPDVPPPGPPTITLAHIALLGAVLSPFQHQIVKLDGGALEGHTFEHSRVIFTENAVQMKNVTFVDCVFEMPNVENPNPYLKQASQQLLASNLKSVTIKAL